jgi:nitrite reductase (cytochrome c-552)
MISTETHSSEEKKGKTKRGYKFYILITSVLAVITFGLIMLLVNIFEHKQEARYPFFRVVELTDTT